uniref:Uncharacterized protein n=1 Tax=Arundo donax TaxID=35708 RepID=A0A0A9H461_ARUDO
MNNTNCSAGISNGLFCKIYFLAGLLGLNRRGIRSLGFLVPILGVEQDDGEHRLGHKREQLVVEPVDVAEPNVLGDPQSPHELHQSRSTGRRERGRARGPRGTNPDYRNRGGGAGWPRGGATASPWRLARRRKGRRSYRRPAAAVVW